MTQEGIKEQAKQYIKNNLYKENIKKLINELIEKFDYKDQLILANEIIDNLSNCFYIDGNIPESNKLYTCYLSIAEILKSNK